MNLAVNNHSFCEDDEQQQPPDALMMEFANEFGYDRAVLDQKNEDITMEPDYGYGDAVPDVKDYGDGDTAPDSKDYGYGDAAPDTKTDTVMMMMDYGYGDAAPDTKEDYGYGDAAPDIKNSNTPFSSSPQNITTVPTASSSNNNPSGTPPRRGQVSRRSSMKQAGRVGRRSSIGYTGEVVLQLPGRREPVRRRTSISFDQYEEVAEVEPIKDLTDEPEKLWFQPDEYDMIRQKACFIMDLAVAAGGGGGANDNTSSGGDGQQNNNNNTHHLCTRGLEAHIHRDTVLQEQFMAKRSVLVEQEHQRNLGIFDDEIVAKIYQLTSMGSAARASLLAQQDYKVAELHTRSTRTNFLTRRSSVC